MLTSVPIAVHILVLLFLGFITVVALIGNILVVLAVAKFPRLRAQFCFHILSGLAIADICVTLFVMPWSMTYLSLGYWPFGEHLCKIWMSSDVMCCTASILHLCLVALDRYLAIAFPLRYSVFVKKARIRVAIVSIWVTSIAISFVPINLGWYKMYPDEEAVYENWSNQSFPVEYNASTWKQCELDVNPVYAVISSSTSFYLPFVVCCILYGRILCIAHQQAIQVQKIRVSSFREPVKSVSRRAESTLEQHKKLLSMQPTRVSKPPHPTTNTELIPAKESSYRRAIVRPRSLKWWHAHVHSTEHGSTLSRKCQSMDDIQNRIRRRGSNGVNVPSPRTWRRSSRPSVISTVHRIELKAIRTIGLLLGCFSICWFPFFLAYLVHAFCQEYCYFPEQLTTVVTWIGYANSAINPILYGFLQRDFRNAFQSLLLQPLCARKCIMCPAATLPGEPFFIETARKPSIIHPARSAMSMYGSNVHSIELGMIGIKSRDWDSKVYGRNEFVKNSV